MRALFANSKGFATAPRPHLHGHETKARPFLQIRRFCYPPPRVVVAKPLSLQTGPRLCAFIWELPFCRCSSKAFLGGPGGTRGHPRVAPKSPLVILGPSWGHLEVILGPLGAIVGPSWAIFWAILGHLWAFWRPCSSL